MKRILMTGSGYQDAHFEELSHLGYEPLHFAEIEHEALLTLLPTIDAYILGGSERLDSSMLSLARRLQIISFVGTGYGAFIDAKAAQEHGILITNTPTVMTRAMMEHTIGLLLGTVRGLFTQNEASKRSGSWTTTRELAHLTIGIAGMGHIGSLVAKVLTQAFGCTVLYTSLSRKLGLEREIGIRFTDLDTLFTLSDAVILLVPTTPQTKNLVNSERLALTRPGFILINTASAGLVDPLALRNALDNGQIAAAAFDGYWIEPLPDPQADPYGLLLLPDSRFVVTPHSAAKTIGTWERMIAMAVNNLTASTMEKS